MDRNVFDPMFPLVRSQLVRLFAHLALVLVVLCTTDLRADVQGGTGDPCPAHQPNEFSNTRAPSTLMRFVDRVIISRASAEPWRGRTEAGPVKGKRKFLKI